VNKKEEKLVKSIAFKLFYKYCPMGEKGVVSVEDLFHYGIIGLLKAKKNFKEKKKVPFNAYAAIRIKGEIMDALRKSPLIRLPQEKRGRVKQLEKAKRNLSDKGITPAPDAIASELGWSDREVLKTESLSTATLSVDEDQENSNLIQLKSGKTLESEILNKDLAIIIQKCMELINDASDRLVFVARDLEDMTLKQVGSRFGFSIEKTRQKHIRAKESMKSCLKKNGWDLTKPLESKL
jgi:RNA polymerase sigma factor for flagellar operon FliA